MAKDQAESDPLSQLRADLYKLFERMYGTAQEASKRTEISESRISRLHTKPVQKDAVLGLIADLKRHFELSPETSNDTHLKEAERIEKAIGLLGGVSEFKPTPSALAEALAMEFTPQKGTSELVKHLSEKLRPALPIGAIIDGGFILQEIGKKGASAQQISEVQVRVDEATVKLLSGAKRDSKHAKAVLVHYLTKEIYGEGDLTDANIRARDKGEEWYDALLEGGRKLCSARARMAKLDWPEPYHKEWLFMGSRGFNSLYGSDDERSNARQTALDIEAYRVRYCSGSRKATDPGHPPHGFFGSTAFIMSARFDALESLYLAKVDVVKNQKLPATGLKKWVAPKLIAALLENGRLRYNSLVAVEDVAPTHHSRTVKISSAPFVRVVCESAAVAVDGYDFDGSLQHSGIDSVAEDGKWMLMRSGRIQKGIKVSILLITRDNFVSLALKESVSLWSPNSWCPTQVQFSIPADFDHLDQECRLVEGIENAARRIMERSMGKAAGNLQVSVTGFALDTCHGLQPNYFCLAYSKNLEAADVEAILKEKKTSCRFHRLVTENPAISLAEIYGGARFAESDQLLASVFFAWKWFAELSLPDGYSNRAEDLIGRSREELLQRIAESKGLSAATPLTANRQQNQ